MTIRSTIPARPLRVMVLGGSGTIGRATIKALAQRGHHVVSFVRPSAKLDNIFTSLNTDQQLGIEIRFGDVTAPSSLAKDGFCGEHFDALVSCLASRTGAPKDAWAIDYDAHVSALHAAKSAGVSHFVLLSAICVQKPMLAFQKAKLAFEQTLITSGIHYTIVRPTAFFKSLSGQIERLRRGKPFLVFGNGDLTACKPVSDDDLAAYLADCVDEPGRRDQVLPIGGPGNAITPREQGERLFTLLGLQPKFRRVPVKLLDVIIAVFGVLGHLIPAMGAKAEFARIGRYYATESMLVRDSKTGNYDAAATPSTGSETLFDYYEQIVRGQVSPERGDHAVF